MFTLTNTACLIQFSSVALAFSSTLGTSPRQKCWRTLALAHGNCKHARSSRHFRGCMEAAEAGFYKTDERDLSDITNHPNKRSALMHRFSGCSAGCTFGCCWSTLNTTLPGSWLCSPSSLCSSWTSTCKGPWAAERGRAWRKREGFCNNPWSVNNTCIMHTSKNLERRSGSSKLEAVHEAQPTSIAFLGTASLLSLGPFGEEQELL